MTMLKRGENIGRILAGRVQGLPAFKKMPKKKPARWAIYPDFRVKAPKQIGREESERDYAYDVAIFSTDRRELPGLLDQAIRVGTEEIEKQKAIFWLHAVNYSTRRAGAAGFFVTKLRYIFRVRPVPEQIP